MRFFCQCFRLSSLLVSRLYLLRCLLTFINLLTNNYEKEKRLGLFPGVVIPGAYDEEDVDDSEFMKLIGKELGDESFEKYF
uniref:Uncharacterized protein n=1 Tax=Ditylenchus dipsaci TaxID=166011 RepID=A0A915CNV1_9BILA